MLTTSNPRGGGRASKRAAAPHVPVTSDELVEAVSAAATRLRLLDAAGAVFAEVGFERAHVRDICARAKANVAAVKYHFGGKFQLYQAAVAYWFERLQRERALPPSIVRRRRNDATGGPSPRDTDDAELALRQFLQVFVGRLLDESKPAWHAKLMAREMVEPTGALDAIIEQSVRPTMRHLRGIVAAIVGPRCPKLQLERLMLSVLSQCVFYVHCRPVLERVMPGHVQPPDVAAIAEHVYSFSVHALRAARRGPGQQGAGRAVSSAGRV